MKVDKKTVKYIIYARKSTESSDKQVQSIDDQIRLAKARAKREGLNVVAVLSEAKSGGKPGIRTEFNKMIEMINDGKANGILSWKLDRISRNPQDSGYVHQMINDHKIHWILTDGRDYSEDDDIIFDVESSMDARYRKDLMKNVRRGMQSKAEKGWRPCMPPVGYMNDRYEKIIVKDPERWDLVRKVFDKFLLGTTNVGQLTQFAEEIGLRTFRHRKIGGQPLSYSGIRSMLQNKFYAGALVYNGVEYKGNHPALISVEEYDRVQELIGGTHNNRPQKECYDFLFRGMVKCATCGYAIVSETKTRKYKNGKTQEFTYCHCSGKCKKMDCPQRKIYINEKELVKQVKDELAKYTIDQEFFNLAIEALAEEEERRIGGQEEEIARLQKQQLQKKNELSGLRRMRYSGEITDQEWFMTEQKDIEGQIEGLGNQIAQIEVAEKRWREIADETFMFARYAKEDFDSDSLERKQYVLKALGAELKLSGRTLVCSPVKYLIPIQKAVSKTEEVKETARTCDLQGSNDLKRTIISTWCWK